MADQPVVRRDMRRKPPSEICTSGDVAFVTLSGGFSAIIDAADVPLVAPYRWTTLSTPSGHAYAYRRGPHGVVLMHRELTGARSGEQVDHKDGDGLNNRRQNMRVGTPALNQANKVVERRNKLGLKGVYRAKGRFQASIKSNGQGYYLGSYLTPEEAAAAYRGAAKVLWGDFAHEP